MPSEDNANDRMNRLWERFAIGLLSVVLAWGLLTYQGLAKDVKDANDKIVLLQMDKVGKADMREMEIRVNSRMDANFSNLAQRVDANQQDIMRQLQLYFGNIKSKN